MPRWEAQILSAPQLRWEARDLSASQPPWEGCLCPWAMAAIPDVGDQITTAGSPQDWMAGLKRRVPTTRGWLAIAIVMERIKCGRPPPMTHAQGNQLKRPPTLSSPSFSACPRFPPI